MAVIFDAESIYEISKPYLKLVMDARMDKPKAICPFNFFKVGGIKNRSLIWSQYSGKVHT